MNAAVDEGAEQLSERQPEGPGAHLRAARQDCGLELERVAAQLHIQPAQVADLEQDRYDGFAARVFVRGYLRNYARLVNLPPETVLAMFDAVFPDPDRPQELRRVGSQKPQVGSGHGAVRMVSWALLLGLLALFLVWWAGYLRVNGDAGPDTALQPDATLPATGQLLEPIGQLPTPAEPGPEADQGGPAADAGDIPDATTDTALPVSQDAAVPQAPAAEAAADPVPVPDPAPAPAPAPVGPQVVLNLSGACWVQIRDSSGDYKLIGELKAGTHEVLGGTPPYRVLLGNASVAELTVNGQPVDLGPYTRGQVARLTLDPDPQ